MSRPSWARARGVRTVAHRPRIVLIGAGRFGVRHLEMLQQLEREGALVVHGVVVRTQRSADRIAQRYHVRIRRTVTPALLQAVDGVIVATPPAKHAVLARRCLRQTHVLVEKPMACSVRDAQSVQRAAQRWRRVLMVGHIFRFHPVVQRLKRLARQHRQSLRLLEATFINPGPPDEGVGALRTFMHPFDMFDELLGVAPRSVWALASHRLRQDPSYEDAACAILMYPHGLSGWIDVGWSGASKMRTVTLSFLQMRVVADLLTGRICIERRHGVRRVQRVPPGQPLRQELECFVRAIRHVSSAYPDGRVGCRITAIVEGARQSARTHRVVRYREIPA